MSPPDTVTVRVLTLNSRGGSADADALLAALRQHAVDVLAIQELTWDLVHRLDEAGLAACCRTPTSTRGPTHRAAGCGPGWPLTPLESVPGLAAAAPRARAEPAAGRPSC